MKLTGTLARSAQVARQVMLDVLECLQFKTISYQEFLNELERMLDLVGHLGVGIGRNVSPYQASMFSSSSTCLTH